jgi:hypothetical protein
MSSGDFSSFQSFHSLFQAASQQQPKMELARRRPFPYMLAFHRQLSYNSIPSSPAECKLSSQPHFHTSSSSIPLPTNHANAGARMPNFRRHRPPLTCCSIEWRFAWLPAVAADFLFSFYLTNKIRPESIQIFVIL